MARDVPPEFVRATLAALCDRAISQAHKPRCGIITAEKGLGKLRWSGRNRVRKRLLNYWARTMF